MIAVVRKVLEGCLRALIDIAASVVGRANAQAAGRRLFAAFNNQRLK